MLNHSWYTGSSKLGWFVDFVEILLRKPRVRELQENRIDISWTISRGLLDLFCGGWERVL